MLPDWIVVGALSGAAADLVAARLTAHASSQTSLGIGAIVGAVLAVMVQAHPLQGWHRWLLPLWLWGWFVAAGADLRAQELYDYHTVGLLALALAAGVADRYSLVSASGAVTMGGLWLAIRG